MIYKNYPYLQDSYYEDANSAIIRRDFLSEIDSFVNQKQYVKITLLNWKEEPLKEIQGEISSGTLSKDGSSSVRRTAQLTASVSKEEYDVENSKMDFAINKKIFLEIGIKNYTNRYKNYPILWFPQGVFFIGGFNIASSTSTAVNITIQLKDKMASLNGDVGGTIPATTILDELDTQDPSGEYVSKKVLLYDIILELVNHFGGEDLNNIVIEDVDTRIKQVLQWRGSNPLYLIPNGGSEAGGDLSYQASLEKPKNGIYQMYSMGDDVGYIYTDLVWIGELTAAPGDTVVTVLDKIKNFLGNYEYFYDEFGVFHFREIKNYLNTTQGKILLEDMNKNDYLIETTAGKSVYTFNNNSNLISINCNPKYENIKNDYVVHGIKKITNSNISSDITYHLAIDRKPQLNPDDPSQEFHDFLLYKEDSTNLTKGVFPKSVEKLPEIGDFNTIYKYNNIFYYWADSAYKEVKKVAYYEPETTTTTVEGYRPKDWRTYLYVYGLQAKNNGTDAGYYFAELDAGWPQIYDLEKQQFYGEGEDKDFFTTALTSGVYFLDFIDPSTSLMGEFSVDNIGRRTQVVSNDQINCLFQPEIPNIVFINIDNEEKDENGVFIKDKERNECIAKGQPYSQVKGDIFWAFATGGYKNGAYDQIKYELYLHTNYQKTLSLTSLPVFYLEPNSRITINDKTTNTYGDYVVSNITIPLGVGSIMSTSCSQALERF